MSHAVLTSSILNFSVGDILKVTYRINYFVLEFKGICIALKNKKLLFLNSFFLLRNVVSGVAVELLLNFNFTFILRIILNKHKKKKLNYKSSKLFFYRKLKNRISSYV